MSCVSFYTPLDTTHSVNDLLLPLLYLLSLSTDVLKDESQMEEWRFFDDHELQSFKGIRSCSSCQSFVYGVGPNCQPLAGCKLRQALLVPGDQQLRSCEHWRWVSEQL